MLSVLSAAGKSSEGEHQTREARVRRETVQKLRKRYVPVFRSWDIGI